MIYLSGAVRTDLPYGVGYMLTPNMGNRPDCSARPWAADTGLYSTSGARPFDQARYLDFLDERATYLATSLFATAPDVVGDAATTLGRSLPVLPLIRERGYRAAFVAQDGLDLGALPWDAFDALFLGGTTAFKLGAVAEAASREAKRRGLWLHMGRVNSLRRMRIAESFGCDSVDGTFLAFGPDVNLPRLARWLNHLEAFPCFDFVA